MSKKLLRIFALGGNEVSPTGQVDPETGKMQIPDIAMQWKRTSATCELIADIIKEQPDNYYILTHGNGPQVGNILLRSEYSRPILHKLPLDICGADTQGGMGYMIAQLSNSLRLRELNMIAAETVTQVVVDKNDPAFMDPTKFIGPAMTKEEAQKNSKSDGYRVKMYKVNEDGVEVWRRVVPSPAPVDIVEIDAVEAAMKAGIVPISVGGGGVPVVQVLPKIQEAQEVYECNYGITYQRSYKEGQGKARIYRGVEAVIDKDLASALLGNLLQERAHARGEEFESELIIFTDVDGIKLNYQKPDQVDLTQVTLSEIKQLYDEGNFPEGSMGPKVKAVINFLRDGGKRAYISKVSLFKQALEGKAGTIIVP